MQLTLVSAMSLSTISMQFFFRFVQQTNISHFNRYKSKLYVSIVENLSNRHISISQINEEKKKKESNVSDLEIDC